MKVIDINPAEFQTFIANLDFPKLKKNVDLSQLAELFNDYNTLETKDYVAKWFNKRDNKKVLNDMLAYKEEMDFKNYLVKLDREKYRFYK